MYIERLHASDFRLFKQLDIKLNPGFNFIVGSNSSGKTSILRCISMCTYFDSYADTRFKIDTEFWIDFKHNDVNHRTGLGKGWINNENDYRQGANLRDWFRPPTEGKNLILIYELEKKLNSFCPLFIGAYRKLDYSSLVGMTKEPDLNIARRQYRQNSYNYLLNTVTPNVKQWMINRYFILDKDWAIYEKKNWDWLIENMSSLGPNGSNLEFLHIQRELEPKFKVFGNECYLEELSAGFQAILSLIFSIFEWLEQTNEKENMLAKNAVGTVLIDELDAHLHPEWQLTIRNSLRIMFPNLQFIITTHSPHIIASAEKGEVIKIKGEDGIYNLVPSEKAYSGWSTDQILEDIMDVKSLENKDYKKLFNESMDALDDKNTELISEKIEELEKITHSSDTTVEVLKIKLAKIKLEIESD